LVLETILLEHLSTSISVWSTRVQDGYANPGTSGHARPPQELRNRPLSSENGPARARKWTPVPYSSFPRNEGVLGSSPSVGSSGSPRSFVSGPGRLRVGPGLLAPPRAGGAIRRAWTRLPGGGDNPVALIRIPRERIIGYGVASTLVHEVGHQGAALLHLVESLRDRLRHVRQRTQLRTAWGLWDRWVSEIVADIWSISRIGISSTLGLMGWRRPAPHAVDPGAPELRDRRLPVPGPAVEGARRDLAGNVPRSLGCDQR
jgi:hypothetical protein